MPTQKSLTKGLELMKVACRKVSALRLNMTTSQIMFFERIKLLSKINYASDDGGKPKCSDSLQQLQYNK